MANLIESKINSLISKYNQGNHQLVIDETIKLSKENPRELMIWNLMGASYKGLGDLEKAEMAFKKAFRVSFNPTVGV